MTEWFEDETFWADLYPVIFPEDRFAAAPEEVERLLALTQFRGTTVLDLACGPGRHSVPLAQKGYKVVAVDRSKVLLEKGKARASAANVIIEWVHQDMRTFVRPHTFDLALNLFTSFGFFDNKADDLRVLRNLHESLKAGAVALLEMASKEWLARVFQPTTARELSDGSLWFERHEIFDDWSRIRNDWILVRDDEVKRFRFHHTIYSGQELKDRLHEVGFSKVRLFGDLDGNDFGVDAKRLVAAAWKE